MIEWLPRSRIHIRRIENLRGVCYATDESIYLTTTHLGATDDPANEIGVLVLKSDDRTLYTEIWTNLDEIVAGSEAVSWNTRVPTGAADIDDNSAAGAGEPGHLIRCGRPIPYDPASPFCESDLVVWRRFANPTYPEKNRHARGGEQIHAPVTSAHPLCRPATTRGEKRPHRDASPSQSRARLAKARKRRFQPVFGDG